MSSLLGKLSKILRDYCENTSLVGLGYVSNKRIHITERIFWLICIIISAGGSYFLIREYQNSFESKAISLVIEGTTPQDKTLFPSIGICEDGEMGASYPKMTEFVRSLHTKKGRTDYNYQIEDYLMRIVFENMFTGDFATYCEHLRNCDDDCVKCPNSGYKEVADMVRSNCSQLIINCKWNSKDFNCCDYFLPLQTPIGRCFILNSEQTTERNGPNWLRMETGWDIGFGQLQVEVTNPIQMHLLNPEDVPLIYLRDHISSIKLLQTNQEIQLSVQRIINDQDVREISPEYRRCKFPDENSKDSGYKHYSFTSCVTDCLKKLQLQTCNCTSYNYLVHSNDKSPTCDYDGFLCLARKDVFRPSPSILQPWRSNGLSCKCLPSCTEHEITVAGLSARLNQSMQYSSIKIRQTVATQQYRRQAVRTQLDVVVTIGGILGLFMGASILSGIEIFYFFFVRIFNLKKENN